MNTIFSRVELDDDHAEEKAKGWIPKTIPSFDEKFSELFELDLQKTLACSG